MTLLNGKRFTRFRGESTMSGALGGGAGRCLGLDGDEDR